MANKDSMIFYQEWRKAVVELTTEERCRIYEAIFDYAFAGIEPQDAIVNAITSMWRTRVDKDSEAYENVCKKNRANVKKRWERVRKESAQQPDTTQSGHIPNNTTEYDRIQSNTTEYEVIPNDTKNTDNDYDNDVAKATIITPANAGASATADEARLARKEEKVNFEALLKFFNDEMDKVNALIPRAKSISRQRLTLLKARIREYGKEAVADVIRKAARSNFLNGGGSKGFKADFTWIMRPENFLNILEGKFDNDTSITLTSTPHSYGTTQINSQHNDRAARQQEFTQHIASRLAGAYDEPDVTGNY